MATTTTTKKQPKADPKQADIQEPDAQAEAAAPPPKKRGWLKIALLLVLVLGGAGGAAAYFMREPEAPANAKPGAAKAPVKATPSKPPTFVTLEPFTVNLQHEDTAAQYLQVGLALKINDAALVDAIKLRMPEIRNRVLLLLSSKKSSEISTAEGKQTLSTELMREITQPLAGSVPSQGIDSVLFTSFVIQ
jgi:flagellar FliL protein